MPTTYCAGVRPYIKPLSYGNLLRYRVYDETHSLDGDSCNSTSRYIDYGRRQRVPSRAVAFPIRVLTLLQAVLATAKENNEHLKMTITVGGSMVTIIVALFAIFGYREVRAFLNPLNVKLTKLEADYSSKSDGLTKKLEAKLHNDIRALLETGLGLNFLEMATSDAAQLTPERRQELLNRAVAHMDKALNRDSPEDSVLVAYIHGHKAYALKRLGRPADAYAAAVSAFNAAEKAGNRDSQATPAFNAACYACLQGETEHALRWLDTAVKLDGHNAHDAWDDDDLAPLRADPRFKEIVGRTT